MLRSDNPAPATPGLRQFGKFLVVGISNFGVSFAVFYLLYNHFKLSGVFYGLLGQTGREIENFMHQLGAASLDATLANVFGYSAGIINSFLWNRFWTFRARQAIVDQFGRFLALNITCLILSSAALFLFTDSLGWDYLPVWFVTMGIITLINFFLSKYWVFVREK